MTTELIIEQKDFAEVLTSFMMDDGDIAVEQIISPQQASSNPFFVGDQPMDTAVSSWMASVTFDTAEFHDRNFEIIGHDADAMDFAIEDTHVIDVDLSGLQA